MSTADRTFTLADSFDSTDPRVWTDVEAPLPLGYAAAIRRALQLRATYRHLSYRGIAEIMGEYHGVRRSSYWWRQEMVRAGAELRPHGVPFTKVAA